MDMIDEFESGLLLHIEEVRNRGFTVLKDVVTLPLLEEARERLDAVINCGLVGRTSVLAHIKEENLARCPLAYDCFFTQFATAARVTQIAHA